MHSTVTKSSILYPYNCKNVDRLSNRSKTYQFHILWRASLYALLGLYIKHNAAGALTLGGRHNMRGAMSNAHSLCFPAFVGSYNRPPEISWYHFCGSCALRLHSERGQGPDLNDRNFEVLLQYSTSFVHLQHMAHFLDLSF